MTDPLRPCENCTKAYQMHEQKPCPKGYKPGTMIKTLGIPPYMYEGLERNTRNFHVLSGPADVRTGDIVCFQRRDPLTGKTTQAYITAGVGVIVEGAEWGLPETVKILQLEPPQETTRLKAYRETLTRAKQN